MWYPAAARNVAQKPFPRRSSSNVYDVKDADTALESFNPVRKAQKAESSFSAIVRTHSDVLPSISQRQLQRKRTSEVDVRFALARDKHKRKNRRINHTSLAQVLGNRSYEDDVIAKDKEDSSLRDDEASFIPAPENPEDTEYFDSRGATLQSFAPEFEDQGNSSAGTPGADYPDRPHDALSRVRSQISVTTIPLHIPTHVQEGRTRRPSEPVATDDFGNFSYKNLPVLQKADKDVIQKLRAEAMQAQSKPGSSLQSPTVTTPSLDSSLILSTPLKQNLSTTKGSNRPASPSVSQLNLSPNRASQPSSPLLVSFSTSQNHDRRKTSSSSSTLSHQNSSSLQPGNFFDAPRLVTSFKPPTLDTSSPIKIVKTPGAITQSFQEKGLHSHRQSLISHATLPSPRARSQTIGSQKGNIVRDLMPSHHKRRSQVFDISPSSSDTEDSRQKALLRVQRRRQSSRRLSQISLADGPMFRKQEDARFAKVEQIFLDQQEARVRKEEKRAAKEAAARAAEAKKKGDEDKLAKLEILDEQLKWEATAEAARAVEKAEAESKAAKDGIFKETEPTFCIKYTISEDMTKGEQARNKARLSAIADRPRILGSKKSSVLGFSYGRTGIEAHRNHGTLLLKDRSGFSVSSREDLQKKVSIGKPSMRTLLH